MTNPDSRAWFRQAGYGLFIHWGPYAAHARGEQVLMRELIDQRIYSELACAWNPTGFDAAAWADLAVQGGFRYAVMTARHHDGYCLWDTQTTDYSSARQAPRRDFLREYIEAFRQRGLRVGIYLSWNDFRLPALFAGPARDPAGWNRVRAYVHAQVEELCTKYGAVDIFWFDGTWPGNAADWDSAGLVAKMRRWQPQMLINNRLGELPGQARVNYARSDEAGIHETDRGDFGTPEHHITASPGRLWESCQVANWRLWGYAAGERWRPTDVLLDQLVDAAAQGGNLLLNVGPDGNGVMPAPFVASSREIGAWLKVNGEAIFGAEPCDLGETVLFGRQTKRGQSLYLICRFWHGQTSLRFHGLATPVRSATLLGTDASLTVRQGESGIEILGLPVASPTALFPVIKLELAGALKTTPTYHPNLWGGDAQRFIKWAQARGSSVSASGK